MGSRLLGVDGYEALFNVDGDGVLVNTRTLSASTCALKQESRSRLWLAPEVDQPVSAWGEVAECCSNEPTSSDVTIITSSGASRLYTIPKAVQREAQQGLVWRAEKRPGGTGAGVNIARTLARGGQVSLRQVQYVARYFSQHEGIRSAETWSARDAHYPTRARVAWSLWGGDAGHRWAGAIADREQKATIAAGSPDVDLKAFVEGDDSERQFWGVLLSEDSLKVDALLTHDPETYEWMVWADGSWEPTDEPSDPNRLVELDDESAIYVGSSLYDAPEAPVALRNIDPFEYDLVMSALASVDWGLIDMAMTAAGEGVPGYTPQERAQNAKRQLRDANGRFATVGSKGADTKGNRVTVRQLDRERGLLIVTDDLSGQTYMIPPSEMRIDPPEQVSPAQPSQPSTGTPSTPLRPLDLRGILGQPRAVENTPRAMLPRLLPPMNATAIKQVIADYGEFIRRERLKNAGKFEADIRAEGGGDVQTPDNSDVPALHLAIVDRDDPQAVMELVALVPASTTSNEPTTFKRVGAAWVADPAILNELRSATPPPVVNLDEPTYQEVLSQVDNATNMKQPAEAEPTQPVAPPGGTVAEIMDMWDPDGQIFQLVAAGGVDQNRGDAEKLRRYWLYGPGAVKIRWNTPGDWRRCVRHLSKYMGTRAQGYCALRHKEATGHWTGDKENLQNFGPNGHLSSTDVIKPLENVVKISTFASSAKIARARVAGVAARDLIPQEPEEIVGPRRGSAFSIPLVIPEGVESGDGRKFVPGALTLRELPIPLLWQVETSEGHDGSVLVGRVDRVQRVANGLGNATGVFDTGPHAQEAERLVREGFLRWVSADLDQFRANEDAPDENSTEDEIGGQKMTIRKARLMAITLVPKPAFQECTIELIPDGQVTMIQDGTYIGEPAEIDAAAIVAAAQTAAVIPLNPPRAWFDNPRFSRPTAIHVEDDGRVYGHIASWDMDHIGMGFGTRPPRSRSRYAYFHTGVVRAADGSDVPVGQLTLAGGHAGLELTASQAVRHYDDTASAIADVHAGEDEFGVWIAGAIRPEASPEQIRALRASAPSGDWRLVRGNLELVAICQVNVPGFPVTRAQVASGAVLALVAAGAQTLARMKGDPLEQLTERVRTLEAGGSEVLRYKASAARAVLLAAREEHLNDLSVKAQAHRARIDAALEIDDYLTGFKNFDAKKRKELAGKKHAMKDGSFPIENASDLRRAIRAYGRADPSKKPAVRRHIIRRARGLGQTSLIPDSWNEASLSDLQLSALDARATVFAREQKVLVARGGGSGGGGGSSSGGSGRGGGSGSGGGRGRGRGGSSGGSGRGRGRGRDDRPWSSGRGSDDGPGDDRGGARNESEGRARPRFTPETQPRDTHGQFRQVLARLRANLGSSPAAQDAVERIRAAEDAEARGNYDESRKAAEDVIGIVDRIDEGAIDPTSIQGVREGARALGKAIAELPLPFGDENTTLRYSDLPQATHDLVEGMIERVEDKLGEDAGPAVERIRNFMAGGDQLTQEEISAELNRLLRLLT